MRSLRIVLALAVGVATLLVVASASGQATVTRVKQPSAGAIANFGNCPDTVELPPVGTVCRESYVIVFRDTFATDGGSLAPTATPWAIYATTHTLTFTTAGADPVESDVIDGFLVNPSVASSDREHLSTATVTALIPMSDGSSFDFQGTWTGDGARFVYGNDGPYNLDAGFMRHYADRCSTVNSNAHQKFRHALMTGTLNGQPVHSYTSGLFGATIFDNHFVYIDVAHQGCQ
jgi:hypothetical protein